MIRTRNLQWLYQNAIGIYFEEAITPAEMKAGMIRESGRNAVIVEKGRKFLIFELIKTI